MEDDQKSFEEQRSRLISDFAMEKERLLNELRQKDLDTEVLKEKLVQDKKDIIEHLNREFTEKIRMIDKRNQVLTSITHWLTFSYLIEVQLILFYCLTFTSQE